MKSNPAPKPLFVRLQLRLAQARFLTFSALLHVIIVVTCGSVVLINHNQEAPDFAPDGGDLFEPANSVQPPPVDPVTPIKEFTAQSPTTSPPTLPAITTQLLASSFTMPAALPLRDPTPSQTIAFPSPKSPAGLLGIGSSLPKELGGRFGGTRMQRMLEKGGKPKSDEAVMRGLRWLVKNQNGDGSWSKENRPAMTGFAVLSFLGHGDTPVSPEFGPTIQKAIEWLLQQGNEFQGKLSMTKGGWGGNGGVYEHAICAYALAEYYSITEDERAAPLLKQAIEYIVRGQGPDGGWMYSYDKSQSDTSVSGWQIQALKAAHLSKLKIEGVADALDKAMLNLKRVQGPQGGFGYRTPEDRYSLTGVGVLCTYFWKQEKSELVREGIKFMLDKDRPDVKYKGDSADLYAWYYNTQACLMVGGNAWSKWNGMFQDELCNAQSLDGSWPPVATKSPGPLSKPDGAGPFYRTNLCILMLEVFYRYAPISKG